MIPLRASDEQIQQLLRSSKTIAIVGLSGDPQRPSYGVAEYLKDFYTIIPVNPQISTVFGLHSYPSLETIPSDVQIDIVNIFRKSEQVLPIVEAAVAKKARCIWMQLGVQNNAASLFAISNGMLVVEDACIAVLHSRLARTAK